MRWKAFAKGLGKQLWANLVEDLLTKAVKGMQTHMKSLQKGMATGRPYGFYGTTAVCHVVRYLILTRKLKKKFSRSLDPITSNDLQRSILAIDSVVPSSPRRKPTNPNKEPDVHIGKKKCHILPGSKEFVNSSPGRPGRKRLLESSANGGKSNSPSVQRKRIRINDEVQLKSVPISQQNADICTAGPQGVSTAISVKESDRKTDEQEG